MTGPLGEGVRVGEVVGRHTLRDSVPYSGQRVCGWYTQRDSGGFMSTSLSTGPLT